MSISKFVFLTCVLIVGSVVFFCEYLIFYVVIIRCSWSEPARASIEQNVAASRNPPLHVMLLADTHLLGSRKGHPLDKLLREWQMYRSFQTAMQLLKPDVVFFLGDLMDEGLWCSDAEFLSYHARFKSMFYVPEGTSAFTVVGNHDIGFHYWITPYLERRFVSTFKSPPVQFVTLSGVHFVLINSMAMEGDSCYLCRGATVTLTKISKKLNCSRGIGVCDKNDISFSRPIILQHFPLYRESDEKCNEPDDAPDDIKLSKFKESWDCLSKESTDWLLNTLKPRLVVTGHTHHGCHVYHPRTRTHEYTIPSFSWRNKDNPSFGMLSITSDNYSMAKCHLPRESTIIMIFVITFVAMLLFISLSIRWHRSLRVLKTHYF